jgi:hypothetical protein
MEAKREEGDFKKIKRPKTKNSNQYKKTILNALYPQNKTPNKGIIFVRIIATIGASKYFFIWREEKGVWGK